jgi:hypothetical protein
MHRTSGNLNLSAGDLVGQLKLLYERYCANTGFPLPSAVAAFFPTMEKRSAGYTRSLGVRLADACVYRKP